MQNKISDFELLFVIVHHGLGTKILRFARAEGIFGGTIFYGQGTAKNFWLELFELFQSKKEIIMMVAEKGIANRFLDLLNKQLQLEKHNHGIAFTMPVTNFTGGKHEQDIDYEITEGEGKKMYNAIFAIVRKGDAEKAVEAAQQAGAQGGTIINARGAGRNETSRVFLMDIEPEKEILIIISKTDAADAIVKAISEELELDEPGNGIIFVQEINKTYGLYEEK